MSKYYKAEEVERLIENVINVMIGKEEPIETALSDLPTIDIVRCKDCKFRIGGYHNFDCMWDSGSIPKEDDFCSYGVREESEE